MLKRKENKNEMPDLLEKCAFNAHVKKGTANAGMRKPEIALEKGNLEVEAEGMFLVGWFLTVGIVVVYKRHISLTPVWISWSNVDVKGELNCKGKGAKYVHR